MSPSIFMCSAGLPSFPRVSGDEPDKKYHATRAQQFSPRERG